MSLKVSVVSFINSYPFVYGLEHFKTAFNFDIQLCPPAQCAENAINKCVDFALVPIAALPLLHSDYELVSRFCIGAQKSVSSVLILSNTEIKKTSKIFLDKQSLTSVKLVKILSKYHWQIKPEFIPMEINSGFLLKNEEAMLAIGDKCFDIHDNYKYTYDLFDEWNKYAQLPFVFAVWVVHKSVETENKEKLNRALDYGVINKKNALLTYLPPSKKNEFDFYLNYISENINYFFDSDKQKALTLYLDLIKNID